MNSNCKEIAQKQILNKNPFYAFNLPIALLVAIIVFGLVTNNKLFKNSYIVQIIIPVLTFLLTIVIIEIVSRNMISKEDKKNIILACDNLEEYKIQKPDEQFVNIEQESIDNQNNMYDQNMMENYMEQENMMENNMEQENMDDQNMMENNMEQENMDDQNMMGQPNMMQSNNGMMQPNNGMMQPNNGMMQPNNGMMQPNNGMMQIESFRAEQEEMEYVVHQSYELENIDFTSLNPFPLEVD